jgi:hypothetical protein
MKNTLYILSLMVLFCSSFMITPQAHAGADSCLEPVYLSNNWDDCKSEFQVCFEDYDNKIQAAAHTFEIVSCIKDVIQSEVEDLIDDIGEGLDKLEEKNEELTLKLASKITSLTATEKDDKVVEKVLEDIFSVFDKTSDGATKVASKLFDVITFTEDKLDKTQKAIFVSVFCKHHPDVCMAKITLNKIKDK